MVSRALQPARLRRSLFRHTSQSTGTALRCPAEALQEEYLLGDISTFYSIKVALVVLDIVDTGHSGETEE